MRIISGKYKGRRFEVPRSFKARPTTDFAKESLFNLLCNQLDFDNEPTALDLFAGTGSISLELVSRGCSSVISVEKDRDHYAFINRTVRDLKEEPHCTVLHCDVFKFLKQCKQQFDLIFADPPYALTELESLPTLVLDEYKLLKKGGIFVLEHGKTNNFENHPLFLQHRHYGSVNFSFFGLPE